MSATDRVGIEIDLMGYEEALKHMQNLEREMKSLNGRKVRINAQNRLKQLEKNARSLRAEYERLKAAQASFVGPLMKGQMKPYEDSIRKVRREMSQTNAEAQRLRSALSSVKPLRQVFNGISSSIAHAGSAMQSMGNAISRLMTPLRMMSTGALLGAGFKAMNTVSEGLSKGFSRYDTMKKYPKIMASFGYSAKQAQKSIDALDQSVRGLPTGLDEMVDMAQRFTATTGDIEKGTDIAIAANNAFLASMSTDTQKYQGMMQLQDVLGGKDMNAREWGSLVSSMTPAIVKMGESLGYTKKNMDEWIQKVRDGKVANEDFIDTLIKVGTKNGEVAKMANESKDTWQAFTANVGNAFSRMSAGIIQSLDEIVNVATGGKFDSVNMLLAEKITPAIDKLTQSAKDWIKGHPDEIINFFNDLKSIDWAGLAKGFGQGIGEIVGFVQKVAKWASGKNLEGLGKFIFNLNLFGQGLLVLGGIFKGARGIVATIGTIGVGLKEALGVAGIGGASSALGKFVGFFKNFGKVGAAATAASGAAGAGGAVALGATFKAFIPAIEGLAGVGAILTMASGIAALDTKLLSMAVDNMVKITDGMGKVFRNVKGLKGQDFDAGAMKNAVEQMFQIWEVFSGSGETVDAHGAKRGGGRSIAQMDKKLLSDMSESMKSMSSIVGSMALMKTNLKDLKGFKGFNEKVTEGVTNFATALGGIYTAFNDAFAGEGKDAIDPEQAKGFSEIIKSTESMFTSLGNITKTIPKLMSSLGIATSAPNGGMGESPLAAIKRMLIGEDTTGGMFGELNDIFQKMTDNFQKFDTGDLSSKMANVVEAFRSIRKLGNQLSKMGSSGKFAEGAFDGVINGIKSLVSKIGNALDNEVIGDIALKAGNLQVGIEGIFNALNQAVSDVEVTVKISGTVEGHDKLISLIKKADKAIRTAVNNIKTHYTKTITVDINSNVNTSGTPNMNTGLPKFDGLPHNDHKGGYIKPLYRASGGSIFKPHNSDTVPAMLTPGEWVMRRSAVNAFGQRFMDRINNMDIRGAMRELSARAGHIASVNRGITYNYTTNNNQQVTQNINTNNPNFAYKRSNRYVMAL